jgi:L-malate glycosyltransferase
VNAVLENGAQAPVAGQKSNLDRATRNFRAAPGVFLMVNSLETGGSERQFLSLTQALDRERFQLHQGCIYRFGPLSKHFAGIPEFRLGGSLFGLRSVKTRFRLAVHLRQRRIQIAHAFDFYTNILLGPTARAAGIPVVIGSHRQVGDLLTKPQFLAQLLALKCCDRVVCNSRAAAEALIEGGLSRHRIAVIGNGLPEYAFSNPGPALPRKPGVVRIGMIARMNHEYKGHQQFLRMAARIADEFGNLEFVLVGDGPLRPKLEGLAHELGIAGRIQFLGDRSDVTEILASLDMTVLCSRSESLSNVILESMAAGVPAVATRVGGNVELLERSRGILVPSNDDVALAAGVRLLLSDRNLRGEIAETARKFAAANYSLPVMARRHEELYQELLAEKGFTARSLSKPAPIKLAIVAPSLRYVGGQSVQADLFLRNWQGDPDVEADFIAVDPELPPSLAWIAKIPALRTIVREPLYIAALLSGLAEADIAHIFSASYWSFRLAPLPARFIANLKGKFALVNYHSGEARDHLQRFPEAITVLKKADKVVVPSPFLKNVFEDFDIGADVVPNIADLSQFKFHLRKPLSAKLVCTRGFHRYYAIDAVVRAFAEVGRQMPDATLALVGKGPTEDEIRKLTRNLGVPGITFAGVAPRTTIGEHYDRADVFINASVLDNMPVSIIEAFASGTPVVSTCPDGMEYLVEHERTGLLSPPGDVHALAENVLRLFKEPELAERLARNAFEESQKYTWEVVRDQWLQVYRELMVS